VEPTSHRKIQRAVRPGAPSLKAIEQCLMRLEFILSDADDETLMRWLQESVPSYQPATVKNAQAASSS
jgi:hypothetical protein